ncbi:MAG: TIM barrel protein [Deltaproteobacteria bacterium]|nr:TIM barrel protein [Deltaproteobacteria bacterium]
MSGIRVGNAPVSFGVYDGEAEAKGGWPWSRFLDDVASAGYQGTELGPYGYLPVDPARLGDELGRRSLALASSFVPAALGDRSRFERDLAEVLKVGRLLKSQGVAEVILADCGDPGREQIAGRVPADGSRGWSAAHWSAAVDHLHGFARALRDELGLALVVHHHVGTYLETPSEIERLLASTDADLVGLLLDTGHAVYGGGDPLALLAQHGRRVRYLHFKDLKSDLLAEVRRREIDLPTAWKMGVFCALGEGCVDFRGVLAEARRLGYGGWVIVEQDVVADDAGALRPPPADSARASRRYLRDALGL